MRGNTERYSGPCMLEPVHSQGCLEVLSLVLEAIKNRRLFHQAPWRKFSYHLVLLSHSILTILTNSISHPATPGTLTCHITFP